MGLAIVFPFLATKYLLTVAILGLIYVLLGLGLNIVVGLAGLLDLGYVAFYAIGAYGLALGYQYLGLGFWAMLPLGAVMAALAGALLGFPVLRMHGDYLAIVTLGFGEIIRLVLNNWVSFTGGPNGVPVPSPTLFGLEFTRRAKDGGIPIHEFFHVSYNPNLKFIFLYAVLCLVVMLVLLVKHRLTRMPIGRAWEALREDEIACRAMGLNHVLVKLSAFMLGASTAGIAQAPEGRRIFPDMTVEENLLMGTIAIGNRYQAEDKARMYQLFPRLEERRGQRAMTLSGGEQQMLAIARALMSRPRLLLLDEPSLGLAPLVVKQIFQILRELTAQGMTLFLVEQNARHALNLSDRAYVMVNGQIRLSGSGQTLLNDPEVRKAYLGISG
ncbi:ABC transporter permease subunit [Klebsiella pneumoniae]